MSGDPERGEAAIAALYAALADAVRSYAEATGRPEATVARIASAILFEHAGEVENGDLRRP